MHFPERFSEISECLVLKDVEASSLSPTNQPRPSILSGHPHYLHNFPVLSSLLINSLATQLTNTYTQFSYDKLCVQTQPIRTGYINLLQLSIIQEHCNVLQAYVVEDTTFITVTLVLF